MESINLKLKKFFDDYEARVNKAVSETREADAEAFADCFIGANPLGVTCGKNDEQFRATFPGDVEFYRSLGTKSMKITMLRITPVDDYHSMVRTHWDSRYVKKDGNEVRIEFDVTYLVQAISEKPRIFAYITPDEQKILNERGLIP